ncbi:MAG: hypothetical protein ACTSPO_13210 [Candidatus Heimdallarchaeaceae archaeon]
MTTEIVEISGENKTNCEPIPNGAHNKLKTTPIKHIPTDIPLKTITLFVFGNTRKMQSNELPNPIRLKTANIIISQNLRET